MRALFAVAALLTLAACGSPKPPEVDPAKLAAIAALPAPYNEANYTDGRRAFAQCMSCHVLVADAPRRLGPNLHGIIGRHAGSLEGFTYSDAMKNAGFVWDAEHLNHWIENPQAYLPGTRMAFAGVTDETQRRDLIAYLMVEASN